MARDEVKKHQPATPLTTIMENLETKVLEMLALRDANSLGCACGILGLVVPDQKSKERYPQTSFKVYFKAFQF